MGRLIIGAEEAVFSLCNDDLLHLQAAAERRFRDGAGFFVGLANTGAGPDSWTFRWLHPSIPVAFVYDNEEAIVLDPARVDTFVELSEKPFGFMLAARNRPQLIAEEG